MKSSALTREMPRCMQQLSQDCNTGCLVCEPATYLAEGFGGSVGVDGLVCYSKHVEIQFIWTYLGELFLQALGVKH